jgi:Zn-dependent protease with chaperone function
MANLLKSGADYFGLLGILTTPMQLALLYWSRRSELSADRAAAAAMGSAQPMIETLVRLSGGSKLITAKVDILEFAAQAQAYDELQESTWDKVLQKIAIAMQEHPFPAVRVREIMRWCDTEHYQQLIENIRLHEMGKKCSNCSRFVDPGWRFCKHCGAKI